MLKRAIETPRIKRPRIYAINMMRVFIIAAVISTHIVSSGYLYDSVFSGMVWMTSHVSRNLFVFLTALVLMYNYGVGQKFSIKTFYLKRFTLILLPYAVWTLIYQIKDGIVQGSFQDFASVYLHNFITAEAMYHLYFLLITMQIYLFFPLIRIVYGKIRKVALWKVLTISVVAQVALTAVLHSGISIPGLQWWLDAPDNFVVSYQLYIVAGIVFAARFDEIVALLLGVRKKLYAASIAVFSIGTISYFLQVALGADPAYASAVFQPYLVIASIVYGAALIAFSAQWVKNGKRFSKPIAAIAEDSFAIYLSHVLFITYFAKYFQSSASDWYVGLLTLVIGVPVVYGLGFLFAEIARRTWLSLPLTGRKMIPFKQSRLAMLRRRLRPQLSDI